MDYDYQKDTFKMEIVPNDERIKAAGYDVEKFRNSIDKMFEAGGLEKGADGLFYGKGDKSDWARFGAMITSILDRKWFNIDYVDTWIWYEKDDFDDSRYLVDDVIESVKQYRMRKSVVA